MTLAVSWSGRDYTDLIGKDYGFVSLSKSSYKAIPNDGRFTYSHDQDYNVTKCEDFNFHISQAPEGETLYCFSKPELMDILEHNNENEEQNWFQILAKKK